MRSLSQHLEEPALVDPPTDGTATEGCAGGSCGVIARVFLDVDGAGVIRNATARVRGRDVAFATASALCESAIGRSIVQAAELGLGTLHASFGDMSDDDRERALVVEDAFHHALGLWCIAGMRDQRKASEPALAAAVAMSGGVDSAVALHDQHTAHGRDAIVGVTLRLWIDPKAPDPDRACCAPDSVRRARATCHALGVGHLSLDLRDAFARTVVAPFIERYRAGETPNPCVGCNGSFRLDEMVAFADVIGAATIATGHYVRTARIGGRVLARRGVDRNKDQSYMLSRLSPDTLARYRFPLGELLKPQVRERAAELGLEQATVRESQEVCFLGGGDYRGFLGRMQALGPAGEIRLQDGTVLGSHEGIAGFTPGQRRGLGVNRPQSGSSVGQASTEPLYVLDTDPDSGAVTVGDRQALRSHEVHLRDAQAWIDGLDRASVQLRYRTRDATAPATISWGSDGTTALVRFDEPVYAPAAGQTACMYDDQGVVVGVGTITRPAAAVAAGSGAASSDAIV